MTLFFLLVGLELKRELIGGELSRPSQVVLPSVAALGGMLVPALIYYYFNGQHPETSQGWAIPVATDIAFALGALALLGNRVPASLKIFLAALAVMDDLAAIIVIAVFYTAKLSLVYLLSAALIFVALTLLNRVLRVIALTPY